MSRGAEFVYFVEKSRECLGIISENLKHTKFEEKSRIINEDYLDALDGFADKGISFGLVFLDPPYSKGLLQKAMARLVQNNLLKDGCMVIAERDIDDNITEENGNLFHVQDRKYRDTVLSFYRFQKG